MNQIIDLIASWKMLRYDELPSFELYSDQLLSIAEEQVLPLSISETYSEITSSMVNNYVKAGIIDKPVKKKYTRDQLATLIVISMLKTVFSLGEINEGIQASIEKKSYKESYNGFCDDMEDALKGIFLQEERKEINPDNIVAIASQCVAKKLYVQYCLLQLRGVDNE